MHKILVIDDSTDILEAIQMILSSNGYQAELVTKGNKVYKKLQKYKPDLIILDVLLSGSDGRTICKKLKSDKATCDIPILMMSAHPLAKKSLDECSADSFVSKPFSIDELISEVKRLLKNK
jgi:DNA-binding response OmpR family regulator